MAGPLKKEINFFAASLSRIFFIYSAAAANEYAENTKNDAGFKVPQIYWNFTSENVMTLDWIDGRK